MIPKTLSCSITALAAFLSTTTAAPHNKVKNSVSELSLTAQLEIADSVADQYPLLPNDESFVFDYNKNGTGMASKKTFPALVGTGASMAIAEIGPCGMASLHIHPRAAELFVVISGRVHTEMVPEAGVVNANGAQRVIRTELGPNMMTVFPKGSFHTQMNPDCKPALIVASFPSEDPGVGLVAPQTFALNDDAVAATFGQSIAGEDIDTVRKAIPQGAIFKVEQCLQKCGIQKRQV